jgi:L-ribulokinase
LGLDFGTESVRALLVDLSGRELGGAVVRYTHGQITDALPGSSRPLPPDFALQHPADWIESASRAVRAAMAKARLSPGDVIGIGVDFTSCTMLPALADGTPLCLTRRWAADPYAWPKLWKHHAAHDATDRLNRAARIRREPWLARYGGVIGLEWFFPKILETLQHAPAVYDAADVWLEAGDWFVWRLVGGAAHALPRSTCQAGYKAMWNRRDGYPCSAFFASLHPKMKNVAVGKMPGTLLAPGQCAGELTADMARRMGLATGTPVSAAIIDAHAGVPGAGAAEPGNLVMVLGTSSCHMINAERERIIPGVAGVVADGILPGYYGYETGQAAVGDAFDWLRRTVGRSDYARLMSEAEAIAPGSQGVMCVDWLNGCRTPLMDGSLAGAFLGLTLRHTPGHLYRALLEASAFGLRWIVELLRDGGVPVRRLTATGGLPHHNPLLVRLYADVLGEPILVHPCKYGPALGAAILGVLAAGRSVSGFASAQAAIGAMAKPKSGVKGRELVVIKPRPGPRREYREIYHKYRRWADRIAADNVQ